MKVTLTCTLLTLLLTSGPAVSEIHKCTETDGSIRYSDSPCDGSAAGIRKLKPGPDRPSGSDRLQKTRKLLRAFEAERREEREQLAREKVAMAERRENCARARDRLKNITAAGTLYRLDENGNRTLLSDSARQQATEEAHAAVRQWCD